MSVTARLSGRNDDDFDNGVMSRYTRTHMLQAGGKLAGQQSGGRHANLTSLLYRDEHGETWCGLSRGRP
jgi:hypothetical protein